MTVHNVDAYPEIKRLLDIPKDEPIFILRAKDITSLATLINYEDHCYTASATREFLDSIGEVVKEFSVWRAMNDDKIKIPD